MENRIDYPAMIAEYEQNARVVSEKAEYYAKRAKQPIDEADGDYCERTAISYRNIARELSSIAKTLRERNSEEK